MFIPYRFRQGFAALRPKLPSDRDAILASVLTQVQAEAFRSLPVHDQAHLLRVFRALRREGVNDRDLLTAALLHDLGKVGPHGRVRFGDRVARVVLAKISPGLLARLARSPAPRWRHGLALCVNHPADGAARAAALGCSARSCWLIAHHEDEPPPDDPDLGRLILADRSAEGGMA